MKVLKKIRQSIAFLPAAELRRNSLTSSSSNPLLCPLRFHTTHGDNIQLSNDGSVARRAESFCKGIAFSARPIRVGERVCLRFVEISTSWSGVLRFGFTNQDPSTLRGGLPKYACPDLTNKPGFWAKALGERMAERQALLYYFVTPTGDVHYGINGEDKGLFFSGVDTRAPLWALVDIYGNSIALELVDTREPLNNTIRLHHSSALELSAAPSPELDPTLIRTFASLSVLPAPVVSPNDPPLRYYHGSRFSPLSFHPALKGSNITLTANGAVAARAEAEFCRGYVFTERPLWCEEQLVIQVLETEALYVGALVFGLTSCDPATVPEADLPEDSDLLLDRPEYWVVSKDIANMPKRGDELSFWISNAGEVQMSKNRHPPVTVMHVDHTLRLWAFFDIYGNTQKIKLLGTISESRTLGASHRSRLSPAPVAPVSLPTLSEADSLIAILAFNPENVVNQRLRTSPRVGGSCEPHSPVITAEPMDECTVCYERVVDSVLYACGHMCMCYECARQLWTRPGGGQCPICRADIRDVIRTYRS